MFSVLQIITEAQECARLSVPMAASQLLANFLLFYSTKSHSSASFMWPCGWLPPLMRTQVTCVTASSELFPVADTSGCWLEQRTPKPSKVAEAQWRSSSGPPGKGEGYPPCSLVCFNHVPPLRHSLSQQLQLSSLRAMQPVDRTVLHLPGTWPDSSE